MTTSLVAVSYSLFYVLTFSFSCWDSTSKSAMELFKIVKRALNGPRAQSRCFSSIVVECTGTPDYTNTKPPTTLPTIVTWHHQALPKVPFELVEFLPMIWKTDFNSRYFSRNKRKVIRSYAVEYNHVKLEYDCPPTISSRFPQCGAFRLYFGRFCVCFGLQYGTLLWIIKI